MTNENILKNRLLRGLLMAGASVTALHAASIAYAQADQTPDSANATDATDDTSKDTIIVTGSRIPRAGVDTVLPALSIGTDVLEKRAFTNIADALNEVPTFGAGVNPNGNQNAFTVGQNFVDLFNLGTQRTLTLVNGRRFVSSNVPSAFSTVGGLQVDLNVIPVGLLDRIEVVPMAGAAVYGSDAIAGVVNVILKDDYEGFEFSGQYGVTEEGDNETWQVQALWGGDINDGRGNVAVSVEYNSQQGSLLTARDWRTVNNPNLVNYGNLQVDLDGDGVADNLVETSPGVFATDVDGDGDADTFRFIDQNQTVQLFGQFGSVSPTTFNIPSIGFGSLPDGNFYQFDAQGNLNTCTPGVSPGASSLFFAQGGTCGVDFFDNVGQIRSPLDRLIVSSTAHYDILDNVRFVTDMTFANSTANELVNQGGFQTFAFGGTSGALTLNTSNPFLSDQARGILESNLGPNADFGLNRFNNDLVNLGANSSENFTWRVAPGLEGDFDFEGRHFNWAFDAVFGQADVDTKTFGIVDGRFLNAIDVVQIDQPLLDSLISGGFGADNAEVLKNITAFGLSGVQNLQLGDVVCQVSLDVLQGTNSGFNENPSGHGVTDRDLPFADGCVPLNLFGDASSQTDAINFINGGGPRITSSDIDQRVFTATVGGDLFELPGGWAQFNAGFENRRERAVFDPGLGTSLAITRSSAFIKTGGKQGTREWFGEMRLPVADADNGIPFVKLFEIDGSVRHVKTDTSSIQEPGVTNTTKNTAWQGGGRWSPIDDVTFRGSFASAVRLPSLVELFSPTVQAFLFANDPCDARFITGGIDPATRAANCAAAGITQPFTSNVVNATIVGATSGNTALRAESSKAYNVGAVFRPRFLDNFILQADFFRINIKDRIQALTLTQIMNACFDSPQPLSENPFCSPELFRRDASGQVVSAKTSQLNAANSVFKAFQIQSDYTFDLANALGSAPLLGVKGGRDLGEVEFNVNVIRSFTNLLQLGLELPSDSIDSFADPKWQGTFDTTWLYGPFRFFYRVQWQDSPNFSRNADGTNGNNFILGGDGQTLVMSQPGPDFVSAPLIDGKVGKRIIQNASIAYTYHDAYTIQFGVDNIADRKPNRLEQAAGYFGIDELLGRRYTFRVRSQF